VSKNNFEDRHREELTTGTEPFPVCSLISTFSQSSPFILHRHSTLRTDTKLKVFLRRPHLIKVMAFKNGTKHVFAKVTVPNIDMLLEESTMKLNLISAARRVFLPCGKEVFQAQDIPPDTDVYISSGESFVDPLKTIKDHLSLTKAVSWTMNGIVLPLDKERGKTKPIISKRMKNLTEKTTARILVFKNGTGQDGYEIISPVGQIPRRKTANTLSCSVNAIFVFLRLDDIFGQFCRIL
uniref:Doublecortin domain-containing protein n=1 Tax=Callorhinchus milii TaxID=7868 RepID=A0A4W3JLD1_CALMI